MRALEWSCDYEKLILKKPSPKNVSVDERKSILEYIRVQKIHQPDVVMLHGTHLLRNHQKALGDDVWSVLEQVCQAALHLGMMAWSAYCVEKLMNKFPASKRVKRCYALYREAVGEWEEGIRIYKEILVDSPENTFARKRLIAIRQAQGKYAEAIEAANKYLAIFETDKDMWHELAEMYLVQGMLSPAKFCFEDLIMQEPRNVYVILSYAEVVYSIGQDLELARKYFCLACEIDETNLRALWGLFMCNCQLTKKDQGSDKLLQLQTMTIARLKKAYSTKDAKKLPSTPIMLAVLDEECGA